MLFFELAFSNPTLKCPGKYETKCFAFIFIWKIKSNPYGHV